MHGKGALLLRCKRPEDDPAAKKGLDKRADLSYNPAKSF